MTLEKINCSCEFKLVKFGPSVSAAINSSFLFSHQIHCMRKWLSSSTFAGYKGQKRCSLGSFERLYLPFSIIRPWSESLNLVNVTLYFLFLISER